MLQVVVGAVLALVTRWVLDGGIRSRDRRIIREELELAELLGGTAEAADLQVMAHQRLAKYMRPSLFKRATPVVRNIALFVIALVVGEIVVATSTDDLSGGRRFALALGIGAAVGAAAQASQALWDLVWRIKDDRAERRYLESRKKQ